MTALGTFAAASRMVALAEARAAIGERITIGEVTLRQVRIAGDPRYHTGARDEVRLEAGPGPILEWAEPGSMAKTSRRWVEVTRIEVARRENGTVASVYVYGRRLKVGSRRPWLRRGRPVTTSLTPWELRDSRTVAPEEVRP